VNGLAPVPAEVPSDHERAARRPPATRRCGRSSGRGRTAGRRGLRPAADAVERGPGDRGRRMRQAVDRGRDSACAAGGTHTRRRARGRQPTAPGRSAGRRRRHGPGRSEAGREGMPDQPGVAEHRRRPPRPAALVHGVSSTRSTARAVATNPVVVGPRGAVVAGGPLIGVSSGGGSAAASPRRGHWSTTVSARDPETKPRCRAGQGRCKRAGTTQVGSSSDAVVARERLGSAPPCGQRSVPGSPRHPVGAVDGCARHGSRSRSSGTQRFT
jgi:hypothetical protein